MSGDIEKLIGAERWVDARRLIRRALRSKPNDHWLLTRLGLTYYEQRRYEQALKLSERAFSVAPTCPLVLWDYAGCLEMLDRNSEAADIYQRLIRRGPKRIAVGPCGEGLSLARGLVADCHLRLADVFEAMGRGAESMAEFDKHLDMRGPGCRSIYPLKTLQRKVSRSRERAGVYQKVLKRCKRKFAGRVRGSTKRFERSRG
jgi:tetratricopeptide (TPR) repeat protein